ncbi:hypothetical protein DM860_011427 [Cuscuta australis]|uniref:Cyclin-like domain-containing protein n=1 Tax=Cuscuta australis TaxID=267555 RepID=A0A328DQB8_9ASTE|nr:hypothetical protein DM860_011427 [Cuscuta australis]
MKRKQSREAVAELDPPPPSQLQLNFAVKRNLRSKLPRRCRSKFSPILRSAMLSTDASFASGRSSVRRSEVKTRSGETGKKDVQLEFSESSCVESNSGACRGYGELKLKFKLKKPENANGIEDSDAAVRSEVSSIERFSLPVKARRSESQNESVTGMAKEIDESEISSQTKFSGEVSNITAEKVKRSEDAFDFIENDVVSLSSALESAAESKFAESRAFGDEVSKPECGAWVIQKPLATDFDLECSEQLFHGDEVFHDYSSAYSELQTDILLENSQLELSDYSPSIWCDSGSQFSEQYSSEDCPSRTFQLFRQFSEEFHWSTNALEDSAYLGDDTICGDITLGLGEEDEESYRMLRSRERRQVYLRDYTKEYCSDTCYGELVIQQRLKMVHWIVQQAAKNELQKETMFLGVNLFDRFLTKGYFRDEKKLQIAGIACLTLATRIEENQPLNCIRNEKFEVGTKVYSRTEVVAMEWVVQEVLSFQCFLPTIYNFLWFYLKAARASETVENTVKYLALVTLLGCEQLSYWPSTVAAVLVILTLSSMGQHVSCDLIRQSHSRTDDRDLPKCMKSLKCLLGYKKIQRG